MCLRSLPLSQDDHDEDKKTDGRWRRLALVGWENQRQHVFVRDENVGRLSVSH